MSNDNQTPKGEEQEKERGLTIKTDFTFKQVEYLISKMVCEFAPQHSQIESPWMFIIRSIKEYPAEFVASPTPAEEKGADYQQDFQMIALSEKLINLKLSEFVDHFLKKGVVPIIKFVDKDELDSTAPQQEAAQGKEVEFDENKAEEFICSQNFTSSKMDIDNILFTGDRVKKLLVLFNNHLFKSQL